MTRPHGRPSTLDARTLETTFILHAQGVSWVKVADMTFDAKGRQVSPGTLRFKAWERRQREIGADSLRYP